MINQTEKEHWLSHDVINLAQCLLWEKRNIIGFEDTEMVWNQFLQSRENNFGQILFTEEKEYWIFVYRKGESETNICD